jgi:hypothetical protein
LISSCVSRWRRQERKSRLVIQASNETGCDFDLTPSVLPQTATSFSTISDRMRRPHKLKMDQKHIFGIMHFFQSCKSWSFNRPVLSRASQLFNAQRLSPRGQRPNHPPWSLPQDHRKVTWHTLIQCHQIFLKQTRRGAASCRHTLPILAEEPAPRGAG